MAIAAVHKWLETPTPEEASRFSVNELIKLVEFQIAVAVAVKEDRVLDLVDQWCRAFTCHARQDEHAALRSIARECGGDINDFREIPTH
jgi:hypothetical protein